MNNVELKKKKIENENANAKKYNNIITGDLIESFCMLIVALWVCLNARKHECDLH